MDLFIISNSGSYWKQHGSIWLPLMHMTDDSIPSGLFLLSVLFSPIVKTRSASALERGRHRTSFFTSYSAQVCPHHVHTMVLVFLSTLHGTFPDSFSDICYLQHLVLDKLVWNPVLVSWVFKRQKAFLSLDKVEHIIHMRVFYLGREPLAAM